MTVNKHLANALYSYLQIPKIKEESVNSIKINLNWIVEINDLSSQENLTILSKNNLIDILNKIEKKIIKNINSYHQVLIGSLEKKGDENYTVAYENNRAIKSKDKGKKMIFTININGEVTNIEDEVSPFYAHDLSRFKGIIKHV